MGKTRDLFKKIRDTKGIFHVKMGTIKDRNGMNLTKAKDISKMCWKYTELKSLSRVRLFATPWTVACQAPLSMGFSRQEYWSELPFPSPGDLPDPGIEPKSSALQADSLQSESPGNPPKRQSLNYVQHFVTPWTACQSPLSMEFSRQEYWSGYHSFLQGIFPTEGSNSGLHSKQILCCLSHQRCLRLHGA